MPRLNESSDNCRLGSSGPNSTETIFANRAMARSLIALLLLPALSMSQNIGLKLEKGVGFYLDVTLEASAQEDSVGTGLKSIQDRCRQRLREVGIEYTDQPRPEYLWVSVGVGRMAFSVMAQFNRKVWLDIGDRSYEISATTWSVEYYGTLNDTDRDEISDALDRTMDAFINEFLKQNGE